VVLEVVVELSAVTVGTWVADELALWTAGADAGESVVVVLAALLGAPPPHAEASAPAASTVSASNFRRGFTALESPAHAGPACTFTVAECGRASHWLARFRPVIDRRLNYNVPGLVSCLGRLTLPTTGTGQRQRPLRCPV